ncbi:hypothetical protein [Treponema sp.]|uniref:hypothetical protein n=1 Tax=Treponema sp. TaxID=166 RepID=UPI003FD88D9D
MTNEEYRAYEDAADKYLDTVDKTIYDVEGNPINIGFNIWKTYIDGFIDGRKDIAQQEIHNVKINYNQLFDEYKKLEKENAELKTQIEELKTHCRANEWHFVQDGDIPTESGRYAVYTGGAPLFLDYDSEIKEFGYWCAVLGGSLGVVDTVFETVKQRNEDEVIAWKDIVPPHIVGRKL